MTDTDKRSMSSNGLTDKQKAFIKYYVQCLNAYQAAKLAGYQGDYNTVANIGFQNLKKLEIKERIDQLLAENGMSANETISRLAMIAQGNLADYSNVKSADDLASHPLAYAIKELKVKDGEIELKLDDRKYALDTFVKLHKIAGGLGDELLDLAKSWLSSQEHKE